MTDRLHEIVLRCGHIIKVDDGPPADTDPPRYFCPLGCGKQTFVHATDTDFIDTPFTMPDLEER